eukprot:c19202_g1_i1.p1 GENE.c19202_g1_i1~~c19202_g1_i1.p1  ORF type:complete len:276 (-),score=58.17 c19202_g1_i1:87-914(-)
MASHTTKKASKGRNNKEKNDSSKLVTNDSSLKTDDLFYCTDCGMGFDNPQALGGHRSQHSRGRVYLNTDISTQKKVRLGEMIAPPLHQQSNSSKRKKHSDESSEIPNPLRARALLSPPTKKRRLVPPNPEPIIVSEINQPEPEKRESDEPPHIVIKNLKHDIAEIEQRKESIGREIKLLSKMLSRLQSLGVFELSHNPQLYFGQHKKQRKIVKSTVIDDSNNDNNSNSETISSIDSQTSTVISKQHSSNHIQNLELIRVNTKNINDQETGIYICV